MNFAATEFLDDLGLLNHIQNERAFQKQPTIFLARKGGLKKSESRWFTNPGLGFKIPVEVSNRKVVIRKSYFAALILTLKYMVKIEKLLQYNNSYNS